MATRHDESKLRWDLLTPMLPALELVVEISQSGIKEYGENDWCKEPRFQQDWRILNSLMRHYVSMVGGERYDKSSHFLHAAHLAWNALAYLTYIVNDWFPPQPDHAPVRDTANDKLMPTQEPIGFKPHEVIPIDPLKELAQENDLWHRKRLDLWAKERPPLSAETERMAEYLSSVEAANKVAAMQQEKVQQWIDDRTRQEMRKQQEKMEASNDDN